MRFTVFLVLSSVFLVSCSSKIDRISKEHAVEARKWKELAKFAGEKLNYWGVTITAQLEFNESELASGFSLGKIKLNDAVENFEVDLLSPEFAAKFACGSNRCFELNKLGKDLQGSKTPLFHFFEKNEGGVFRFYSELLKFNTRLEILAEAVPGVIGRYLREIAQLNKSYSTYGEFLEALNFHLSEDSLTYYVEKGSLLKLGAADQEPPLDRLEPLANTIQLIDDLPNDTKQASSFPDHDWYSVDENNGTTKLTQDELIMEKIVLEQEKRERHSYGKLQRWHHIEKDQLMVGDIACSFSDNSFGRVSLVEAHTLTMSVIGQVRLIKDGIEYTAQPGYLFYENSDFYFIKDSSQRKYEMSDVSTCEIEYMNNGTILE